MEYKQNLVLKLKFGKESLDADYRPIKGEPHGSQPKEAPDDRPLVVAHSPLVDDASSTVVIQKIRVSPFCDSCNHLLDPGSVTCRACSKQPSSNPHSKASVSSSSSSSSKRYDAPTTPKVRPFDNLFLLFTKMDVDKFLQTGSFLKYVKQLLGHIPAYVIDSPVLGMPLSEMSRSAVCGMKYNQLVNHLINLRLDHIQKWIRPVLTKLMTHPKNQNFFNKPVDPIALGIPEYTEIVSKPMDFGTVRSRLQRGVYETAAQALTDVELVFANAICFNPPDSVVHQAAVCLKQEWDAEITQVNEKCAKELDRKSTHECSLCQGETCPLCGEVCLKFEPPVLCCHGPCGQRVKRNSVYYVTVDGILVWCQKCFQNLPLVVMEFVSRPPLLKKDLLKRKSDEEVAEPWVQCDCCGHWVHQICALYSDQLNDTTAPSYGDLQLNKTVKHTHKSGITLDDTGGYQCPLCKIEMAAVISAAMSKHPDSAIEFSADHANLSRSNGRDSRRRSMSLHVPCAASPSKNSDNFGLISPVERIGDSAVGKRKRRQSISADYFCPTTSPRKDSKSQHNELKSRSQEHLIADSAGATTVSKKDCRQKIVLSSTVVSGPLSINDIPIVKGIGGDHVGAQVRNEPTVPDQFALVSKYQHSPATSMGSEDDDDDSVVSAGSVSVAGPDTTDLELDLDPSIPVSRPNSANSIVAHRSPSAVPCPHGSPLQQSLSPALAVSRAAHICARGDGPVRSTDALDEECTVRGHESDDDSANSFNTARSTQSSQSLLLTGRDNGVTTSSHGELAHRAEIAESGEERNLRDDLMDKTPFLVERSSCATAVEPVMSLLLPIQTTKASPPSLMSKRIFEREIFSDGAHPRTVGSGTATPPVFSADLSQESLRAQFSRRWKASTLSRSKLSDFLEAMVSERLRALGFTDAVDSISVRVCSNAAHSVDVPEPLFNNFVSKEKTHLPTNIPYTQKCILLFQETDGVDVCLFCLYVQEFDSNCPPPNNSCIYIAYIDSIDYFRPMEARTLVYHEIVIGYLCWAQARGFRCGHIWACPPQRGDNFIFWCHPSHQRTPSRGRLTAWYNSMLARAKKIGVLSDVSNLWDEYFSAYMTRDKDDSQTRLAARNSFVSTSAGGLLTGSNSKRSLNTNRQSQLLVGGTGMPAQNSGSGLPSWVALSDLSAPICPPVFEGDYWVTECLRIIRLVQQRLKGYDGQDAATNTRKARDVLKHLMSRPWASPFNSPVDPVALNIPAYSIVVTHPMDLGTVRDNVRSGKYPTMLEFVEVSF
jgi:hypothetical protein